MIKLMLHHSMQVMIKIVPLAGNPLAQPPIRKAHHRFHQFIMCPLRSGDGLAPSRLRHSGRDRKIGHSGRLTLLSAKPHHGHAIPNRNMQHQFPNAMHAIQRLGRRSRGIHAVQQLKQSRPMPRAAIKSPNQLIRNALRL